jgi:hypothetical protein
VLVAAYVQCMTQLDPPTRTGRRHLKRLAQLLLSLGCWGFHGPSLKQASPGRCISSPAAYLFGNVTGLIGGDGSPAAAGCASYAIGGGLS